MDPKNTIALWLLAGGIIITAFVRYQSWCIDKRKAAENQAESPTDNGTDHNAQ